MPSVRQINLMLFLMAVALILAAVYMEHVMQLLPCSLCITQRAFFILTGLLGLSAFLQKPQVTGRKIYGSLGLLSAILGACFAGRQLWLQSLPADLVPACGPGLSYIFEVFPFMEALKMLLQGDGNCAHVDKILGLSIAGWSLIAFVTMAAMNLLQIFRKSDKHA